MRANPALARCPKSCAANKENQTFPAQTGRKYWTVETIAIGSTRPREAAFTMPVVAAKFTLCLKQCDAFDGLCDEDLERFIAISRTVTLDPQEYFFRQNDPPAHVYLVQVGEWMTEQDLADGRRQVGGFAGAGEWAGFGGTANYSYSVKALTFVQARKVATSDIISFANDYPSVWRRLHERRNRVMLDMAQRTAVAGKLRAHERLCVLLEKISRLQKSEMTARLNMTRQDIADYVGLNADSVSRGFKKLEAHGIISMDESGRQIAFLQPQEIRRIAALL